MLINNFCSILIYAANICNLKLIFKKDGIYSCIRKIFFLHFHAFLYFAGQENLPGLECSTWAGLWNSAKWDLKHLLSMEKTCTSQCMTERWVVVKSIWFYSLVCLGTRDAELAWECTSSPVWTHGHFLTAYLLQRSRLTSVLININSK